MLGFLCNCVLETQRTVSPVQVHEEELPLLPPSPPLPKNRTNEPNKSLSSPTQRIHTLGLRSPSVARNRGSVWGPLYQARKKKNLPSSLYCSVLLNRHAAFPSNDCQSGVLILRSKNTNIVFSPYMLPPPLRLVGNLTFCASGCPYFSLLSFALSRYLFCE